jgi:glycosyltransferase involved in cell wall biosynthesis
MKIGILGTRGIPNQYGGFEELAEKLSVYLHEKGHAVSVYCSHNHQNQSEHFKGVRRIMVNDPEHKLGTFGQFIYDLNAVIDARKREFDVLLQLGYTSSSVWTSLFPKKTHILTNMDGLEWKRSKYRKSVRRFLRKAEKWAVKGSDVLVSDSKGIQSYLLDKHGVNSRFIPYGAERLTNFKRSSLNSYELTDFYDLVVARMEPENHIESILKAYHGRKETLVLVGKTENSFARKMMSRYKTSNIRWLGGVYEKDTLNNLRHFARIHFHGHSVGGTNPSLLEAMACSSLICAHNNPFNREVLGDNSLYFERAEDIAAILDRNDFESKREQYVAANLQSIEKTYNWESVNRAYLELMTELLS